MSTPVSGNEGRLALIGTPELSKQKLCCAIVDKLSHREN